MNLTKGDQIYVTRIPYKTDAEIREKCRPLTVEVVTAKAVLLVDGNREHWFPKSVLVDSNRRNVFCVQRWFKVDPEFGAALGPAPAPRSGRKSSGRQPR